MTNLVDVPLQKKSVVEFGMSSMSPMTGEVGRFVFTHKVLGKYDANYFFDPKCGYIFVHSPFWLNEAYGSAISALVTGLLARNIRNIEVVTKSISQDALECSRGVDLGGGLGFLLEECVMLVLTSTGLMRTRITC